MMYLHRLNRPFVIDLHGPEPITSPFLEHVLRKFASQFRFGFRIIVELDKNVAICARGEVVEI